MFNLFSSLFSSKSKEIFNIEFRGVEIKLTQFKDTIELNYLSQRAVFANQSLVDIENSIIKNCEILFAFFSDNLESKKFEFDPNLLIELCVVLSIYFLHGSIQWNASYRNKKSLIADTKEIDSFSGFSTVIGFLRKNIVSDYNYLASCLLDISQEKFNKRIERLNNFDNK